MVRKLTKKTNFSFCFLKKLIWGLYYFLLFVGISTCPCSSAEILDRDVQNKVDPNQINIIVVLGHPGSGKGTFAQALKTKGVEHLSIGDFLRAEFEKKSDIGIRWKKEIEAFGILSVGVVKEVTGNLINKIASDGPGTYILDGHVRTLEQAEHLDELLIENSNINKYVVFIETDKQLALQRILNRRTCEKCHYIYNLVTCPPKEEGVCNECNGNLKQRNTDNAENGRNRIDSYEPHLKETIRYYREMGSLIEFNGNLPIEVCVPNYRDFFY